MSSREISTKPFGNCYWVKAGQMLAGEHPGGLSSHDTAARLRKLLDAGIDTFIDLTQEGELPDYVSLLPPDSVKRIQHLRFAIPDHDVPQAPALMRSILDAIDTALAQGRRVYVHCRAGIGRTGTVVGCHLVRHGHAGDTVLDALNELWRQCERAGRWPSIPETKAQVAYVRKWREKVARAAPPPRKAAVSIAERYEGAVLGLAIGDAFGSGGQGVWASDTAMTWCLGSSLIHKGGNDAEDQMQRYSRWMRQGEFSAAGRAVNVPKEVQRAVAAWQWSRKPFAGSHDPANLDPHPLARTAAVALRYAAEPSAALSAAVDAARPTLQSPLALDACRVFAALLLAALQATDKKALLAANQGAVFQHLRAQSLKQPLPELLDGAWRTAPKKRKGDIVAVLSDAWRAFAAANSFREGLQSAVHGSPAAANVGAVYGALAGAYYGVDELPKEWRAGLAQAAPLSALAAGLRERATAPTSRGS